jgi:hypothetical protein
MRQRLGRCLTGAVLASLLAWAPAAGAAPVRGDVPPLTVPVQPIVSPAGPTTTATAPLTTPAPPPLLRVIQLPPRLTLAQFRQVVQELETSTQTRRIVLIAPSFVAMTSPPDADLVTQLGDASGPNNAAVILTPSTSGRPGVFNAAALLYARIPTRLLIGKPTLVAGAAPDDWSLLQSDFQGCFALCGPLSAGQPLVYSQLLDAGGDAVASPDDLLTDLQPDPGATMTWDRVLPLSAAAFAPLFPASHRTSVVVHRTTGVPLVAIAGLILALFIVAGMLLYLWARRRDHRRTDVSGSPRVPSERRVRRPEMGRDALLPVIGTRDVLDAVVRSGLSPEGYVEIDDCLVRATWSDSSPPPPPGQTVTARLVNGRLQATGAGASTPRMER